VSLLHSATYQPPPDLLRRFVPTPLRTRFRLGASTVVVETNDFSLLPALPLESGADELIPSNLEWKLVRDPDVHGLLQEPLLLTSGQVTLVTMGAACLLGVDHERRELLCFIGAEVDPRTFQEFLVPFLCRLSMELKPPDYGDGLNGDTADV
jgi:hypothetical protein